MAASHVSTLGMFRSFLPELHVLCVTLRVLFEFIRRLKTELFARSYQQTPKNLTPHHCDTLFLFRIYVKLMTILMLTH